jgi:hypothetical protein
MQGKLQAQPVGLAHGVLEEGMPFRAGKRDRTGWNVVGYVEHDRSTNANPLHCLQVGCDPVPGYIPVDPEPPHPRPGRRRRRAEIGLKVRSRKGLRCRDGQQDADQENAPPEPNSPKQGPGR